MQTDKWREISKSQSRVKKLRPRGGEEGGGQPVMNLPGMRRKHQSSGGPGPVSFSRQGFCGLLPSLPKSEFMQVLNVYLQIFEDKYEGYAVR